MRISPRPLKFMAQQFWVNNYFIDVTRNQIQHQQQATQLPPKALKVLEVLASRAGEVVSHDELMELVWSQSVVGPNTLQRAIAQLRKAFGDDSKKQTFIKTHSKQGYSLEANVRWEAEANLSKSVSLDTDSTTPELTKLTTRYSGYIVAVITLIMTWLMWQPETVLFDKMTPVTASDDQEFNAAYSPDGRYLVFNRFVSQCKSHLWAKDLTNNQEVRISTEPGHYSPLSWSGDGTQLAYVLMSHCATNDDVVDQCWRLQTLDFAQAWNQTISPTTRLDCANVKTNHPKWLNDGRIVFLQNERDGGKVIVVIYDPISEALSELNLPLQGQIYSIDYSHKVNQIALVTLTEDNQHRLYTLTPNGEILTDALVQKLPHHSAYEYFPVHFAPDGQHFLTEIKMQIYELSLNGELRLIHPSSYRNLSTPSYHPDQDRFTATYGSKDFDIAILSISDNQDEIQVRARSTEIESYAQFQPEGNLVAFVSYRTGAAQIWLLDGEKHFQLSHFDQGLQNSHFSWSPDGQRIVVNVDDQIAFLELNGNVETLETNLKVKVIMPWKEPTKLQFTSDQNDKNELFELDITSKLATRTNLHKVRWAVKTSNSETLFVDQQNRFWLHSDAGSKPLPKLTDQLFGSRALHQLDYLYGTNSRDQLWRYQIADDTFEVLLPLAENVSFVSDIRGPNMLVTLFVGGRRELVELRR